MKKRAFFGPCGVVFWILFILCGFAFADNIYLKNGDKVLNASVSEVTPTEIKYKVGSRATVYTVLKSDIRRIVYDDGTEDVFAEASPQYIGREEEIERREQTVRDTVIKVTNCIGAGYMSGLDVSYIFGEKIKFFDNDAFLRLGPGYGLILGSGIFFPTFFNVRLGLQKGDYEYFWNNRLGIALGWDWDGYFSAGFLYEPSIGVQFNNIERGLFNNISLSLGYNFCSEEDLSSLAIRVEHKFEREKRIRRSNGENYAKQTSSTGTVKEKRSRYFRPGIEINYPVYRSEIAFFNNEFPYATAGAGLFFRMGPENIYLTTGAYAKWDYLWRDSVVSAQLNGPFGIPILRLPLLDISWERLSIEVPALLNFGSGQIRFSGGMLFDFYAASVFNVTVNEHVPIVGGQNVISANDAETLEKYFGEAPTGSSFLALGLDFDIVRYWGLGVKLLIWMDSFGETESYKGFKPSKLQTRISMYFIF